MRAWEGDEEPWRCNNEQSGTRKRPYCMNTITQKELTVCSREYLKEHNRDREMTLSFNGGIQVQSLSRELIFTVQHSNVPSPHTHTNNDNPQHHPKKENSSSLHGLRQKVQRGPPP